MPDLCACAQQGGGGLVVPPFQLMSGPDDAEVDALLNFETEAFSPVAFVNKLLHDRAAEIRALGKEP